MTNNDILKKLRVALQLRDDQIVEILQLVDFRISKGEIGNFFRSEDHPKYVECKEQILRNFLNGLVIYLRGTKENPKNPMEVLEQNKIQVEKNKKSTSQKTNKQPAKTNKKASISKPTKKEILGKVRFNIGKKKSTETN